MTNANINYNGTNYTVDYINLKNTAQTIRQYVKNNYPECKFSVTTRRNTTITVSLMTAPFEVYTDEAKEIAELEGFPLDNNRSYGGAMRNAEGFRVEVYTAEATAVLDDIEAFMHALNYDNSDPYTDYFERGFYDYLYICTMGTPASAPAQEETKEEIAKFEVGKKYATQSICNSDCVWTYTVIARTAKTVTISDGTETKKCRINAKYTAYRGAETILPEGNFSMCPLLDANDIINDPDPTDPTDKPDYSVFDTACSAAAPVKRKKLTEKEWKKQLEAKAAFEAAEKAAERAEIERRFNALQVGDKLSNGETVAKISIEENYIEGTFTEIWTEDTDIEWAYLYYLENFLDGDISFAEIPEPEEIDENQITFDEIAAYSANDTAAQNAPASPIDETAAKRGHESYSTSDYKAGSATAEYNAAVANVKAAADEIRKNVPEEYRVELDKLVNRYAVKLADWTNRKNRVDASCPSWFITGAANYPHRKHEKQMQKLDKLFKEYDTITAIENRIRNFAVECKHRPIKAGDTSAAEKLRAKVEELTARQEQMKQSNAEARRQGSPAPYSARTLSNNRQNLKRYDARLAALEKAKTAPTATADPIEGEGFRVVRNTSIMRLQILFDSKPDERTRSLLKSNGFKWAPSQKAWQRQLTPNAERAARTVIETL